MIYDISHKTTYRYAQPVSISHHVLHLTPRESPAQKCHRTALAVEPAAAVTTQSQDYFGNPVAFMVMQEQHTQLAITARSVVEIQPRAVPEPDATPPWEAIRTRIHAERSPEALDALQFAFISPMTRAGGSLTDYALVSFPADRPILAAALDLTTRIHKEFAYDPTATTVTTPVDEVFRIRRGVCQDFAHLQIACLRALGLPVRYISGYLRTYPPPGRERLVGADASHAWLAVWCGDAGWIDFDPTNNTIPTTDHVTLAWGRDYGDVSPVVGVMYGGGEHTVDVAVDVLPIEPPAKV